MAMSKDYQKLLLSVQRPILLFVPGRLLKTLDNDSVEFLRSVKLLNHLIFYDSKGKATIITHGFETMELFKKTKILKSNVLYLLEQEAKSGSKAFKFLINDYKEELETWLNVTESCKNNAAKDTDNYFEGLQVYLDMQYDMIKTHQKEILHRFRSKKQSFNANRITKFIENNTKINSNQKLKDSVKINIDNRSLQPIIKSKKKPILLLSEKEVDNYLLKCIFNVDFSKINNKNQ